MKTILVFSAICLFGVTVGASLPHWLFRARSGAAEEVSLSGVRWKPGRTWETPRRLEVAGQAGAGGSKPVFSSSLATAFSCRAVEGRRPANDCVKSPVIVASRGEDEMISLRGFVPENDWKTLLGGAVSTVPGVSRVQNTLWVGDQMPDPAWGAAAPVFIHYFFSIPGTNRLTLDSMGIKLEGSVDSRFSRETLGIRARRILPGNQVVRNLLDVRHARKPFLRVRGSGQQVRLFGVLPDERIRSVLLEEMGGPDSGVKVIGNLEISSGTDRPWWDRNAGAFLPLFLKETGRTGSVSYLEDRVVIHGEVSDGESIQPMLAAASSGKPEEVTVENLLRVRPSRDCSLRLHRGNFGRVILAGAVPDMDTKNTILSPLMRRFPDVVFRDTIEVSETVKRPEWKSPGEFLGDFLALTADGWAELGKDRILLSGELDGEGRDRLLATAAAFAGDHVTIENLLTVVEPVDPMEELLAMLGESTIYFDSGSTGVSPSLAGKLNRVARQVGELENEVSFILLAFHDPSGSPELNEQLSLRRAHAVRDRLVALGVPGDRLNVRYGGADDTYTGTDSWKCRRVELSVAQTIAAN